MDGSLSLEPTTAPLGVAKQGILAKLAFKRLGRYAIKAVDQVNTQVYHGDGKMLGKLKDLRETTEDRLLTVKSVFPFTPFPDTICVDRTKVSIISKFFFASEQITSIAFDDLLNVHESHGPVFGTVKIFHRYFVDQPLEVKYLFRRDADKLERILEGIIVVRQAGLDVANIPKSHLMDELRKIGRA